MQWTARELGFEKNPSLRLTLHDRGRRSSGLPPNELLLVVEVLSASYHWAGTAHNVSQKLIILSKSDY